MRILVTGANGYLGRGIVKELLELEQEVIAVDTSIEGIDNGACRISCDLFDVEDAYSYFKKPDVLLHLAWRNGFQHYSDSHIEDLYSHYKFIESLVKSGIGKIAVMGSMHEIGFYEGCVNEDTSCNPQTPYGISKNSLRLLTKMLCNDGHVLYQWLRAYYIVSNSKNGSSIFSKIAAAESSGEKSFPFTTGQCQYDFIDYDQFCNLVAHTVIQDKVLDIINVCSGYPEKLADRVERFIVDNGYSIKLEYGAYPDRPYDSKAIWGDRKKIDAIMADINM